MVFTIAVFVYDLSVILDIAGTMNLLDNCIFIPCFCLAAKQIIPKESKYDFKYLYEISMAIIVTSILIFLLIIITMTIEIVG
jgi:hypothetical protein